MNVKKLSDKQLKMALKFVRKFDCENLSCYACIFFDKTIGCPIFLLEHELNERKAKLR